MRDLRLDFRAPASSSHSSHADASASASSSHAGSNSHPLALAQRIGLQGVLQHTQQLLHLSHAAGAAPVASLSAAEWAAAREQSRRRGDSALPCSICHDDFGTAAQCLLSCTHTFHLSCITSFERFTGSLSCPLCRHTPYERRPIDDGLHAYRFKHAVRCASFFHFHASFSCIAITVIAILALCVLLHADRIQSWWRGLRARLAFFRMRDAEAPSDPALRRRFVERKMERVGRHLEGMVEDGGDEIDALFAEIEGNLHDSRATMLYAFILTSLALSTLLQSFIHSQVRTQFLFVFSILSRKQKCRSTVTARRRAFRL